MESNKQNMAPVNANQNSNNGITLGDILRVLRKNWILIAVVTVAIFVIGAIYTLGIAKATYKSTSTVKVEVPLTSETSSDVSTSLNASLKYVQSVAEAVKQEKILSAVAEAHKDIITSAGALRSETAASYSTNSVFVTISVTDRSTANAKVLAQALAEEISKYSSTSKDPAITDDSKFQCFIEYYN